MKYEETISLIKEKAELVQQDIYSNPLKYIKGNDVNKKLICSSFLKHVKKFLTTPLIDKPDIEKIIEGEKMQLVVSKKKNEIIYTLIDKKENRFTISNRFSAFYGFKNNEIIVEIIFPVDGVYLNFMHLFKDIKFNIFFKFDITNITVYLAMANNITLKDDDYFYIIRN